MTDTRTVHDPFLGKDVQISDRLIDRLRGKYASGPHLPNGNPEFGWRQFQAPPIQHEAATEIERLQEQLTELAGVLMAIDHTLCVHGHIDAGTPLHERIDAVLLPIG